MLIKKIIEFDMKHPARASERNFPGGTKVDTGPPNLIGPQALSGPMPLNHFLSDGCKSSFKSEGITIYCKQLRLTKNTTRHKIGLNPARREVWGSAVSSHSRVRGGAPEALALFMFLEGKIQHLINIPSPNLLKLTSKKRDILRT